MAKDRINNQSLSHSFIIKLDGGRGGGRKEASEKKTEVDNGATCSSVSYLKAANKRRTKLNEKNTKEKQKNKIHFSICKTLLCFSSGNDGVSIFQQNGRSNCI